MEGGAAGQQQQGAGEGYDDDAFFWQPGDDDAEDGLSMEFQWDSSSSSSTVAQGAGSEPPSGGFGDFASSYEGSYEGSYESSSPDSSNDFVVSYPAPPVHQQEQQLPSAGAEVAAAFPAGGPLEDASGLEVIKLPAASEARPQKKTAAKKRRQSDTNEQQGPASFDESCLPAVPPQGELLPPSGPVPDLDNSLIYSLLSDPTQVAHGQRPAVLNAASGGAVYLERQSGRFGALKATRRVVGSSAQLWKISSILNIQKLEGVSFGDDGKGEVWVMKKYGKVRPQKHAKAKTAGTPFHAYYLCYYLGGRDPSATRSEQGKTADHIVGCVYHVSTGGAVEQAVARRSSSGPTDIRLSDAADPHWLRFQDETGKVRGSISLNERGSTLLSTNGDFAEYHQRDSREPGFEEGDLVGFGASGLTRKTKGVLQLGVITRRAIVTGTCPSPDRAEEYDTVAYVGMVPVKVRGKVSKGDFVTPSGRADGTAIATSWRPEMSVGRVYEVDADPGGRCCACMAKRQATQLVTIAVFNPADTVRAELKSTSRRLAQHATRMLAVLVVVVLAWVVLEYRRDSSQTCEALSLQHGQLLGVCDGTCGSSCTYQGCDPGYVLVAREGDVFEHGRSAANQTAPLRLTRTCACRRSSTAPSRSVQKRTYDGIEMRCARAVCPSEKASVVCADCGNENISVDFPEARWSSEVVTSCPAGFSGTARRTCGLTGWGAVRSRCRPLVCPQTEIALPGGPESMTHEQQQRCYQGWQSSGVKGNREVELLCEKLFQHTVTMKESAAGFGRLTVDCPSPQYRGSISAICEPNSSHWQYWSGACIRQYCPAQWQWVAFNSSKLMYVQVHLPQQEAVPVTSAEAPQGPSGGSTVMNKVEHESPVDLWSVVPCCSHLSPTGSCLDQNSSYGYITSRCARNDDGELGHQVWRSPSWVSLDNRTVLQDGCIRSDEAIQGVRMDQSSIDAAVLYRKLAHTLRVQLNDVLELKKYWNMPLNGSLSSISVSMRDASVGDENRGLDWRPVMSVPRQGSVAAIDATPGGAGPILGDSAGHHHQFHEFGRAAAAFADVSCRQLGFKRAVVVTNCQALFHMRRTLSNDHDDANADWWADRRALDPETDVFLELCPEFRGDGPEQRNSLAGTMCPRWLEVAEKPLWRNSEMEAWLRGNALNSLAPENFSLAYDSFFRYHQMKNATGNWTLDVFDPLPAMSSCSGVENDIRQCFWSQLQDRFQSRSSESRQPETRPQTRPCVWKIVVGCTNEHSNAALAAADAVANASAVPVSAHEGVWVLGDQPEDLSLGSIGVEGNYYKPKIFSHFDGPYNCTTGQRVPESQIAKRKWNASASSGSAAADWCWGRLTEESSAVWSPKEKRSSVQTIGRVFGAHYL